MESKEKEIQPSHVHSFLASQPYPWLVFIEVERQTFFDVSKKRYYKESIHEMHNKLVSNCFRGWFILTDPTFYDCYLFNLISLEKIQLPSLLEVQDDNDYCPIFILSSSPSDPMCHILLIEYSGNSFLFCKPGDTEFTKQTIEDDDSSKIMGVIVVGETIYFLIYRENSSRGMYMLCTVLFVGSEVQITYVITEQLFLQEAPDISNLHPYLIEGCGEIFLVFEVFRENNPGWLHEFVVFSMDSSNKRWVKLTSLGGRTIFLSLNHGMICLATDIGVQPDSIYYTVEDDRHLYMLNFQNQTVSTSLPCPIVSRSSDLHWVLI